MPNKPLRRRSKAFTLMEITVTVILVTILAAFALPNYSKAIAKSHQRNATMNLVAMRAALVLFIENNGALAAMGSLNAINSDFGLKLHDPNASYACSAMTYGGIPSFGCTATSFQGWQLRFILDTAAEGVHCNSASCPKCPAAPGTCE